MLENEEQDRGTSKEVNDEWDTREDMDTPDGGFHY